MFLIFYSVLEQFEITKLTFGSLFFKNDLSLSRVIIYVKVKFGEYVNVKLLGYFSDKYFNVKNILLFLAKYIESFFHPTSEFTKNYIYGRIALKGIKYKLNLFIKKKILVFCRCNSQIVKLKFQVILQQVLKTNFGLHFPYYNRLLNFYPYIMLTFVLILAHNFVGLLYYGFTNTAFLFQNLELTWSSVVGLTFLGIFLRSYHFYKMFVPQNVPKILLPFLVIIEIISHLAKIFSLAIRLFANMMSGHVLLHILTGFLIKLGKQNLLFIIFPVLLIGGIILLEFGIAFLQAYVFATLLAIYFEEHFGFSQEDQLELETLVNVNGSSFKFIKLKKALKVIFTRDFKRIYIGWANKRKRTRRYKSKIWIYSVITLYFF